MDRRNTTRRHTALHDTSLHTSDATPRHATNYAPVISELIWLLLQMLMAS